MHAARAISISQLFFCRFLSHPKAILRSGAVLSFLSMPPFPCFYKCRCWWVQQRRRRKQPAAVTAAVLFNIENVNVEKGITRKEAPFLSLVVLAFMEEGGSQICVEQQTRDDDGRGGGIGKGRSRVEE